MPLESKSKDTERREMKKIRRQGRLLQIKQNIQNNERRFFQQVGRECRKIIQQQEAKEAKQFWSKIWEQKEENRNSEK